MIHNKLTDYQIAEAFGDTLSLIYRAKMAEINKELQPAYDYLDQLDVPQCTDFQRWFARLELNSYRRYKLLFNSIDHINKIRNMYTRMKNTPETTKERLNVEKAKSIPIQDIGNMAMKRGNMVSCPFHNDLHPSMKINKNNTAKCFSCGWFGDGIKMFMDLNKVSFIDAVKELNKI